MDKNYAPLFNAIESALNQKKIISVAIDGPCASGKTSLSEILMKNFDARTVSMDDFFLPQSLRTEERYATPGGNIHHERFLKEIAPCLTNKQPCCIEYRRFDCKEMRYSKEILLPFKPLTIIEGSYSLHEKLRNLYDIKVLLTIDRATQKQRLLDREGAEKYTLFKNKWIPLEELYFKNANLKNFCDFVF